MTGKISVSSTPTTFRFIPANGKAASITINGRTYACAANSFVDVPALDAYLMGANGWVLVAGSGTTAQRPSTPFQGTLYHDTTVGLVVVFEGSAWRNPATGAVA